MRNLTPCPEPLQNGSSTLHVINWPTTVVPDSATTVFSNCNSDADTDDFTSVDGCDAVALIALVIIIYP
jgi:hypothetical protein